MTSTGQRGGTLPPAPGRRVGIRTLPHSEGARTEDLRVELNCRRVGEDARISVERARERRLNIEGRDLNADLDVVAPKPPVNAWIQLGASVAAVGCAALAEHLRAVAWPSKFRPHLPEKYDGTTNPSEFLQVYVTAITAAGGNDRHGELLSCSLVWANPDLAHEPYSWDDLVLGGALCEVQCELR